MTSRERVLAAFRHKEPDRLPRDASFCPSQIEIFANKHGDRTNITEYFELDLRRLQVPLSNETTDFSKWLNDDRIEHVDSWGVGWYSPPGAYHFTSMVHPLRDANTDADIMAYPFPNPPTQVSDAVSERVDELHAAGFAVMGDAAPLGGTVFWPAYKLMGMQKLLESMYTAPEMARAILDRVTDIVCAQAAQLAKAGVDIVHTADDLGTQRSLIVSAEMYRTWFKPRMRKVIHAAKSVNPDVIITFHSDGNVYDLIPDFIDIGIDVLNPVQPECMDIAEIKEKYGRDLSFWGGVGTQTTMPFGTPEEVEACVQNLMQTMGSNGGFMIAPTHVIEPEVPWENIETLFKSIERYGTYE